VGGGLVSLCGLRDKAMKYWSEGIDDYLKRDVRLTMLTDYEGE
jgi:hypothetical protein